MNRGAGLTRDSPPRIAKQGTPTIDDRRSIDYSWRMPTARRHHTVPRCLLTGFAQEGDKGKLHVFDQTTGKSWPESLANVSVQRDFYRFEAEDVEPDAVEKVLSSVESDAAPILKQVGETERVPTGDDLMRLCRFVALMFGRVPQKFRHDQAQWQAVFDQVLWLNWGHRAGYDRAVSILEATGYDGPPVPPFETMRDLIARGVLVADVGREFLLKGMLEATDVIAPLLAERKWSLWIAGGGARFVCCDSPAVLDEIKPMGGLFSPGFGLMNTMVSIPINSRMVLSARFEGTSDVLRTDDTAVRLWNAQACKFSDRFIYAGESDFHVRMPDGSPGRWADVIALRRAAGLCSATEQA